MKKSLNKRGLCKNSKISTLTFFHKRKKAQMKLSFGMIFSIILIVLFLALGFYAIQKFLSFQDSVRIAQFKEYLQSDIDNMWKGSQGSQEVDYVLPQNINSVCFKDDEYENLIFNSESFLGGAKIEHIDMDKTLGGKETLCIDNIKGKVKMTIKKDYGEALVTIEE